MPLLFIFLDTTRREPIKCDADKRADEAWAKPLLYFRHLCRACEHEAISDAAHLMLELSQQYKSVKQGNCYI